MIIFNEKKEEFIKKSLTNATFNMQNFTDNELLQFRRALARAAVLEARRNMATLGIDIDTYNETKTGKLVLLKTDSSIAFEIIARWDHKNRIKFNLSGKKLPCPNCRENNRLFHLDKANMYKDLGLYFPTEDLMSPLSTALPHVTWDYENLKIIVENYFTKLAIPCEVGVLSCANCNLRFANAPWKDRTVKYQSTMEKHGTSNIHGRAHNAAWTRLKTSISGFICEKFPPIVDKSILEIGSGEGIVAWQLGYLGADVSAIELNSKSVNYAKDVLKIGKIKGGPYEKASFSHNKFDLVFSHHVIEHVENFDDFIGNMAFHVKPGGNVFLQCPVASKAYSTIGHGHPIGLTTGLLIRSMRRHGLEIQSVERGGRGEQSDTKRLDTDLGNTLWNGSNGITIIARCR
jgi:SAM-dependent methyltransferase